jgi:3-polyprenyl-4-hydroxybenzoate decarboxylase
VLPGFAPEHCLLGAVAIEAVVSHGLQRVIPSVRRVFVTDGSMGRLHAIVTMHRPQLGEGKRAVLLAMGQVNLLKLVIAVEADIDPEDWRQVEWSLAARFRGHEDLIVLPGVKADRMRSGPGEFSGYENRHDCDYASRRWGRWKSLRVRSAAARRSRACARRARSVLMGIVQSLLSDIESWANC